jgi:SAM-dependent methyltransferase
LGICLNAHDVNHEAPLPYGTASFHAVTMLAVFEHIDPARLVPLLTDIRRVLVDDGVLVITTPAAWTPRILRALALLRMVSAEEIDEHEGAYSLADIRATLEKAGFRSERIRTGRFEFGMNQWVTART